MKKTLLIPAALLALAGCASTPKMGTVIPMPGGVYQADGTGATSETALESALHTAQATCKGQQKRHVVTAQKAQYKGIVSQETNRALDTAAQAVANMTGKWVPTLSAEDDHRITLTFQCEA